MKGSFSVEAALIVPIVLAVMVLALQNGMESTEQVKKQVYQMQEKEPFCFIDKMYQFQGMSKIGELFHGVGI